MAHLGFYLERFNKTKFGTGRVAVFCFSGLLLLLFSRLPAVLEVPSFTRPGSDQTNHRNTQTTDDGYRHSKAGCPTSCMGLLSGAGKPIVIAQSRAQSPFSIVVHDHLSDTMISKFIVDHGLWDVHVLKALEHFAGDDCAKGGDALDVGTNLGFFSMAMLAMGCSVKGFEMQPRMAELATLSGCINGYSDRYHLRLGAVSDVHGAELQRVNASGGNLGAVGIVEDGISVTASRLDMVLDHNTEISVMKLDVEGHEDKALYGMSDLFERKSIKCIIMEFTPNVMGEEAAEKMLLYLHDFGFQEIYELDHMQPDEYDKPIRMSKVDAIQDSWANTFSKKISEGGDSRGARFTDLVLKLVP
jgi:FkbM family methyltransferase